MTTDKSTAAEIIRRQAHLCLVAARAQGYQGADAAYELTEADCAYIADAVRDALGRLPTKAEWTDAGHPGIGGKHYEEGPADARVLRDRAGHPLTGYCLHTRPDVFWGQDATRADADRYNAELARLVAEEFGLPVHLVTADPPYSTECAEIAAWIDGHWQDAVIDADAEAEAATTTCACTCGCDALATTTDEGDRRCCEECAGSVDVAGESHCTREAGERCPDCGDAVHYGPTQTAPSLSGAPNYRRGTCGCRQREWRDEDRGGWGHYSAQNQGG